MDAMGMLAKKILVLCCYMVFIVSVSDISFANDQIMAVGIDNKFTYSQKTHEYEWLASGADKVAFFSLKKPDNPKLLGEISIPNSVVGPPLNIAISPDQSFALVANAVTTVKDSSMESSTKSDKWNVKPSNFVTVVNLQSDVPQIMDKVRVGSMPSGMAIDGKGRLALVANRKDGTVSVLLIKGNEVEVKDVVSIGGELTSVAIRPDGKKAFVVQYDTHQVAELDIDAEYNVTYTGRTIPVGLYPWAISITPNGERALVTNIGKNAASDGHSKTVSVIDIASTPSRVTQHVTVGDAPEGVAISPDGKLAVVSLLAGSFAVPVDAWYRRNVGKIILLRIDNGNVEPVVELDVGSFPEGVAFSTNNKFIYVGNFASNSLSVISLKNNAEIESVRSYPLSGPPASLRVAN